MRCASLLSLVVAVPFVAAAEPNTPGSVHKMVIYQGSHRSVHYIVTGDLSASDRQAARELERAENEANYVYDLQCLKHQYVASERVLEPIRRAVQQQLYGISISTRNFNSNYGSYGYASPMFYGYTPVGFGWGGFGGYGGGYSSPLSGYTSSSATTVTRNLGYGMGNEGVLKNALVQVIAREATAEYAAAAATSYHDALATAAASPVLSKALSLPRVEPRPAPKKK